MVMFKLLNFLVLLQGQPQTCQDMHGHCQVWPCWLQHHGSRTAPYTQHLECNNPVLVVKFHWDWPPDSVCIPETMSHSSAPPRNRISNFFTDKNKYLYPLWLGKEPIDIFLGLAIVGAKKLSYLSLKSYSRGHKTVIYT